VEFALGPGVRAEFWTSRRVLGFAPLAVGADASSGREREKDPRHDTAPPGGELRAGRVGEVVRYS